MVLILDLPNNSRRNTATLPSSLRLYTVPSETRVLPHTRDDRPRRMSATTDVLAPAMRCAITWPLCDVLQQIRGVTDRRWGRSDRQGDGHHRRPRRQLPRRNTGPSRRCDVASDGMIWTPLRRTHAGAATGNARPPSTTQTPPRRARACASTGHRRSTKNPSNDGVRRGGVNTPGDAWTPEYLDPSTDGQNRPRT